MIITDILGSVFEDKFLKYKLVYTTISYDHTHKKIQTLVADDGVEFRFRLDESVRVRGLNDGDVFFVDKEKQTLYAIKISEILCLVIKTKTPANSASIGYVIGNRHAKLYFGESENEFLTPYEKTIEDMLSVVLNIELSKEHRVLEPEKSLMNILPNSQDTHHHSH
ncbi:urease accessory protein UreE [Campylobacter pinnipediorum subsp. pinnipediorum]|uniref:urease accessory protein UreE n=1 Tax=Campylobacter pinnipediorum TaxID=1965231 RepID=UPI0009C28E48|nr:urease accessory protein UreE [Campylobacter pinnipediorum]AQW84112.1 urease accessory protein UreE [Campylobacter pinnipediorum subsp. pinnipediorum]